MGEAGVVSAPSQSVQPQKLMTKHSIIQQQFYLLSFIIFHALDEHLSLGASFPLTIGDKNIQEFEVSMPSAHQGWSPETDPLIEPGIRVSSTLTLVRHMTMFLSYLSCQISSFVHHHAAGKRKSWRMMFSHYLKMFKSGDTWHISL